MARRPAQNSRSSSGRGSPKGATSKSRQRSASRGGSVGGIPGWLWAIAGLIGGFALSQYLDSSAPEPVAAVVPKPAPSQTASGGNSESDQSSADSGTGAAAPAQSATPTFEFYTLLPETEVIAPNSDSKSPEPTAKATQEAAADDAANQTKQPEPDGGRYMLQAASFRDLDDAEKLANRLKDFGLLAKITDVRANGDQIWHRVQVGPYEDKRELSRAQDLMVTQGIEPLLLRLQN